MKIYIQDSKVRSRIMEQTLYLVKSYKYVIKVSKKIIEDLKEIKEDINSSELQFYNFHSI